MKKLYIFALSLLLIITLFSCKKKVESEGKTATTTAQESTIIGDPAEETSDDTTTSSTTATTTTETMSVAQTKSTSKTTAKAVIKTTIKPKTTVKIAAPNINKTTVKQQSGSPSFEEEVVRLVNIERANAGVAALSSNNENLDSAAHRRATEIVKSFSHQRPDGKQFSSVFSEFSLSYRTCGENIAAGQKTPAAVVSSWMNSPGHRKNILNSSFKQIGIGYINTTNGYKHYWVQLFYTAR